MYLDGVRMNSASDNLVDIGSIPVAMIERIEIVKGLAPSVWGSALGGVINVISKEGNTGVASRRRYRRSSAVRPCCW